ncbi:MAG: ribonucleoside-diphosphate reductase subunit alpha, partial [Opitutales bacterium]|nr:ribonucleoside-diphosphate reductase subunit alpha [Opitutales bacterium]
MIKHAPYDEDIALKRFTLAAADTKPRFNWRDVVADDPLFSDDVTPGSVKVQLHDEVHAFDPAEVADTIGTALTNLLLSRDADEDQIFTEQNRSFVATVARAVASRLCKLAEQGQALTLSEREINVLIEKILIENDAPDVAKSLLLLRNSGQEPDARPLAIRVIRRNSKEVPWDSNKVEIAVRKAFLTHGFDSEPAVSVAKAVTEQVRNLNISRVHIEEIQDLVQEELMRQGHFKVAEAYILYRAHRRNLRDSEVLTQEKEDARQESMILISMQDGSNVFWDGLDLKLRIDFATIGLDLNLTKDEIETELRRSIYSEMKVDDLNKTIILNAKSLIERDADFSRFAGRL